MGVFPNLSRNVPFCPRLSAFVLLGARNGEKSGQKRTNGDKTGHFGTISETPPFSIYPHLALLNSVSLRKLPVVLRVEIVVKLCVSCSPSLDSSPTTTDPPPGPPMESISRRFSIDFESLLSRFCVATGNRL